MATVGDADAFKALAHPLRVRILRHLDNHGPSTSTALGTALGTTSGTTSYHLRRLERHGFVEDDPERSSRRERWWRWTGGPDRRAIAFPDFAELDDATRAAATEADRVLFADDLALFRRFAAEHRRSGGWARGLRAGRHMTAGQLAAFVDDLRTLLDRHGSSASDAPAGSRPIEFRLVALPADGETPDET